MAFEESQGGVAASASAASGVATTAAVRLLTARRLTKMQLRQKLLDRGFAQDAVEGAVAECERRRFLDDRTFAQLYVKTVLDRKPVGRLRLVHDLLRQGVDGSLAREVVDALDDDEESRIERALTKLESLRPQDRYGQLGRRLERLGFAAPAIVKALRKRAEQRGPLGRAFEESR